MPDQPVSLSTRGAVAIITIERPDRMNALSHETLTRIGQLARQAIADPKIRALVLTGAGDKAFCAGADLKERKDMAEDDIRARLASYRQEMGVLDRSPSRSSLPSTELRWAGGSS